MTIGRFRKSSARARGTFKRREETRRQRARQGLRIEALEDRRLMATGPQLVGIQPNQGDLLKDGDIRNVSPRELVFHFDQAAVIDETTLDAIQVMRSGGDCKFDVATARSDFNTSGQVIVEFQAKRPARQATASSLLFSKRNVGKAAPPTVKVEGRTILVELNSTPQVSDDRFQPDQCDQSERRRRRHWCKRCWCRGPRRPISPHRPITYSPLDSDGRQPSVGFLELQYRRQPGHHVHGRSDRRRGQRHPHRGDQEQSRRRGQSDHQGRAATARSRST